LKGSSEDLEIVSIPVANEDLNTPRREIAVDPVDADLAGTSNA
jgi:hypothetical protein